LSLNVKHVEHHEIAAFSCRFGHPNFHLVGMLTIESDEMAGAESKKGIQRTVSIMELKRFSIFRVSNLHKLDISKPIFKHLQIAAVRNFYMTVRSNQGEEKTRAITKSFHFAVKGHHVVAFIVFKIHQYSTNKSKSSTYVNVDTKTLLLSAKQAHVIRKETPSRRFDIHIFMDHYQNKRLSFLNNRIKSIEHLQTATETHIFKHLNEVKAKILINCTHSQSIIVRVKRFHKIERWNQAAKKVSSVLSNDVTSRLKRIQLRHTSTLFRISVGLKIRGLLEKPYNVLSTINIECSKLFSSKEEKATEYLINRIATATSNEHSQVLMISGDGNVHYFRLVLKSFGQQISTKKLVLKRERRMIRLNFVEKMGIFLLKGKIKNRFRNNVTNAKAIVKCFPLMVACLLYTSPSPRDATLSRMPSSA